MASRKKHVETALVQRPVIDAEFIEKGREDALATVIETQSSQIQKMLDLMNTNYEVMVGSQKIMSEAFSNSLKAQVESTRQQQELLDKKEERKIKMAREKAQQEMLEKIGSEAMALLPLIINKLGKVPVASPEQRDMLKPWLETFSKDDLTKHMAIMTPAQRTAFIALFEAVAADEKARKEKPNGKDPLS